jgi:ABC-2 type transport system ATP-binding protein
VCLHPTASWQLEILEEICERFIFVEAGQLTHAASMAVLRDDERFRRYIGGMG